MTSLYDTALNGMGIGTTHHDIERMYEDHKAQGDKLGETLLLELMMGLSDLERAEAQQRATAQSLRTALERYEANPTISNAEWMAQYAAKVEKHAREAQAEFIRVNRTWRMWVAADH